MSAVNASAIIPIDYYEFRPTEIDISNFKIKRCDLSNLPFKSSELESISCMHVIEHCGLGRYGDKIDPDGDIKVMLTGFMRKIQL